MILVGHGGTVALWDFIKVDAACQKVSNIRQRDFQWNQSMDWFLGENIYTGNIRKPMGFYHHSSIQVSRNHRWNHGFSGSNFPIIQFCESVNLTHPVGPTGNPTRSKPKPLLPTAPRCCRSDFLRGHECIKAFPWPMIYIWFMCIYIFIWYASSFIYPIVQIYPVIYLDISKIYLDVSRSKSVGFEAYHQLISSPADVYQGSIAFRGSIEPQRTSHGLIFGELSYCGKWWPVRLKCWFTGGYHSMTWHLNYIYLLFNPENDMERLETAEKLSQFSKANSAPGPRSSQVSKLHYHRDVELILKLIPHLRPGPMAYPTNGFPCLCFFSGK